jgi:hypothetical protein
MKIATLSRALVMHADHRFAAGLRYNLLNEVLETERLEPPDIPAYEPSVGGISSWLIAEKTRIVDRVN